MATTAQKIADERGNDGLREPGAPGCGVGSDHPHRHDKIHLGIGQQGIEGRIDYGAIGNVTNLAARLCGEAQGGEILLSQRVISLLGDDFIVEPAGEFDLKGFRRALPVHRLVGKAA